MKANQIKSWSQHATFQQCGPDLSFGMANCPINTDAEVTVHWSNDSPHCSDSLTWPNPAIQISDLHKNSLLRGILRIIV